RADELVVVGDRLAGDVFDRRQRRAGALGLAIVAKPRCSGAYCDHVERVAGGVVQVAGDAGAFLGDRELPLARGLLFGEDGALAPGGDRRRATRGTVASVTSTTRAASRLLVREWTTPVRPPPWVTSASEPASAAVAIATSTSRGGPDRAPADLACHGRAATS